jgi:hypothetical protein
MFEIPLYVVFLLAMFLAGFVIGAYAAWRLASFADGAE